MEIITAGSFLEDKGRKVHVTQTFDPKRFIFTKETEPKSAQEFFDFLVKEGFATEAT